jgi:hypothetical protein
MASLPVDVTLVDGTASTTTLVTLDPEEWSTDDARRFVWDVWRLLLATGGWSLQLRELQPYGTWQPEFVADTGVAVTGPLPLSNAALAWLQTAVFDLSAPGPVH